MSNLNHNQSVYSPLRQNLTDSDSEDEFRQSSVTEGNSNLSKTEKPIANGFDHGKYYSSDDDSRGHLTHTAIAGEDVVSGDNVTLLKKDMSPVRKVMFVSSICLCFLTVCFFLWVLPCNESLTCTSPNRQPRQMAWEIPYHDIEFKGPINVVKSAVGDGKSIIVLYRGNIIKSKFESPSTINTHEFSNNGIMLIVGDTGKVGWFIPQQRLPSDIDCSLLDVNEDGIKDCIVVGSDGLFALLNPFSGTMHWYLHNHDGNELFRSIDFPVIIMDVDSDGIADLLTSCGVRDQNHNSIIIVSSKKGSVIGQPLQIHECTSIHRLQIDDHTIVSFTCKNDTSLSESLKVLTLESLCREILNKSVRINSSWIVPNQHPVIGQRRDIDNQRNIYTVANKKLIIENRGNYPKNGKVTVQLFTVKNGEENMIWDYHGNRVYGMVPAIINFNRYEDESKHISGFVLKFWQWVAVKSSKGPKQMSEEPPYGNYNRPLLSLGGKNTKNASVKPELKNSFSYHKLSERVVLVTFNSTDFHIVNATQSDVIQICHYRNADFICQPDMRYQENSLLITDLDNDGSQDLISYLTTFKALDSDTGNEEPLNRTSTTLLKLSSTLRVIRLESELPKLYEAVSHR